MKLSAKKAKRKKKEQKRRRRNLMCQGKCKYCKARLLQKPKHITYSKGNSKKQRGSNQSKIAVILLGAGAGKAWGGPLSSEIDTIIKEDTRFTSQTDSLPLGSFIFNKLEEFYGVEGCVNFETFLGALEFIVDYVFSKTNEGGTSPAITSFTPLLTDLTSWIDEIKDYKIEAIPSSPDQVNLSIPRSNEAPLIEERSNIDWIYFSELLKLGFATHKKQNKFELRG